MRGFSVRGKQMDPQTERRSGEVRRFRVRWRKFRGRGERVQQECRERYIGKGYMVLRLPLGLHLREILLPSLSHPSVIRSKLWNGSASVELKGEGILA